jgi:hypothetical protein
VDINILSQTDLIFAHAIDFWTACVSHTQLQYIYPTPSLKENNTIASSSIPTTAPRPHSATTTAASIINFQDYNHLHSVVAGTLGDYSVRRAYLLSFSAQKAVDKNDALLDDLDAWDKMVALLNSFSSKPVSETFSMAEEALFTSYLKVCMCCYKYYCFQFYSKFILIESILTFYCRSLSVFICFV